MMSCLYVPFRQLFIIKTKGCNKYYKFISLLTLRQYAIGTRKTFIQRGKTAAAASAVLAPSPTMTQKLPSSVTDEVTPTSPEAHRNVAPVKVTDPHLSSVELPSKADMHFKISSSDHKPLISPVKSFSFDDNVASSLILFIPKANQILELGNIKTINNGKIPHLKNSHQLISSLNSCHNLVGSNKILCNETAENILLPLKDIIIPKDAILDERPKLKLINALKPEALESCRQRISLIQLPAMYMKLSKIRLTGLVILTAVGGYAMAPAALDPWTLIFTTIGTGLTSCAANSINQVLEVPYDSQMIRTRHRVLVKGYLTPQHAITFALFSASFGLSTLLIGVNALTAALGAFNLILYTSVYTPMKRLSIYNTWVGSVVGAVPPMMGWAACTGTLDPGACLMGAILFSWQFPHFNALSWNLRPDYSRAGYQMMSVENPGLCRRTTLWHSIGILALCCAAPLVDLTTWAFVVNSLPLNCYLVYCSWRFYKNSDSASSRKLFRLSLVHLPALMLLMLISKKHYSKRNKPVDNNEATL